MQGVLRTRCPSFCALQCFADNVRRSAGLRSSESRCLGDSLMDLGVPLLSQITDFTKLYVLLLLSVCLPPTFASPLASVSSLSPPVSSLPWAVIHGVV